VNARDTGTAGPAQAGPVVSALTDYGAGISAVDTAHVRPRLDASHLIVERGRGAFVDTGTTHALPHLLGALAAKGLAPEAVDWVLLTHIHLDHAGGAGALLARLPNARVVVHPRGAPHLIEPARLEAATRAVYGEDAYRRLFGRIEAIAEERIVVAADGFTVELAGRRLEFLHTPGHALHHCAIVDHATGGVFSGDTFGVSYRDFDVAGREFIFPATTPTQFDPEQLNASIDRILGRAPRAVYLTHYGRVTDIARLGADLKRDIAEFVAIARRHARQPEAERAMRADVFEYLSVRLDAHGFAADAARRHELLDLDIDINVAGLAAWCARLAG
jgi:glyoxylase-like metal-dependent hydrolase (beta-lactamase superfamily II)